MGSGESAKDDLELKQTQRRLLKLALRVYEDQLTGANGIKAEVQQAAANKVLEMHGMIGRQSGPNVDFHLAIPPEYFGEVFRGLQKITVVAQEVVEKKRIAAEAEDVAFTEGGEEDDPAEE